MSTLDLIQQGTELKGVNTRLVTIAAIAVLFLGSLAYLIVTAFDNKVALENLQNSNGLMQDL